MAIYNGGLNIKNVSIVENGSGNAITGISADGNVLTVTRGSVYDKTAGTLNGVVLVQNPSYSNGYVRIWADNESGYIELKNENKGSESILWQIDAFNNQLRFVRNGATVPGFIDDKGIHGAVWNDLADSIPVDEDCVLEAGYCYCFNNEHYTKSSRYLDDGIIGIHSDTYGFQMGNEADKKKMDVAVAGFALAYVDKDYKPGTPLTCTENGYLTEIKREDKIEYPERIVATYWKSEPADEWGSNSRKVKVNGRKWVKVV